MSQHCLHGDQRQLADTIGRRPKCVASDGDVQSQRARHLEEDCAAHRRGCRSDGLPVRLCPHGAHLRQQSIRAVRFDAPWLLVDVAGRGRTKYQRRELTRWTSVDVCGWLPGPDSKLRLGTTFSIPHAARRPIGVLKMQASKHSARTQRTQRGWHSVRWCTYGEWLLRAECVREFHSDDRCGQHRNAGARARRQEIKQ